MASIFTRIVEGSAPAHRVLEDERHLAFLEASPLAEGHTLVIPKKETDYLFDLEDAELSALMVFAKRTAAGIRRAVDCQKVAVLVYGLMVRHAHVHLVPVRGIPGELNLSNAKKADDARLERTAARIREALASSR
ncbi:MAG TPA: HIT family protein [Candidatus Eisenbacteria bacterium]|jgi:histidine triad (HIT) family protein|nr:HIT family protein [Candidatus Eisenbacteria bacterium]